MPQMAPLNWLTLMMYFIIILITFNMINYFTFMHTALPSLMKTTTKTMINWKW